MDQLLRHHPLVFIAIFVVVGFVIGLGRRALITRLTKPKEPLFFDLHVVPVAEPPEALELVEGSRLLLEHLFRSLRERGGEVTGRVLVDGYLIKNGVAFGLVTFVEGGERRYILRLPLPIGAKGPGEARLARAALSTVVAAEADVVDRFLLIAGFRLDRGRLPAA